MRAWSLSGGLVSCVLLGLACSEDGEQVAHGAAGAAGDQSTEGGGENTSGGSGTTPGSEGGASGQGNAEGGPTEFLPLYENGTRLRAVSLGEPGSSDRKLLAWYDSELELRCRFKLAEDGELRCLPLVENGLQAGFADAACERPVSYDGLVRPCSERPLFWLEALEAGVCTGYRVLELADAELSEVYSEACAPEPLTLAAMARAYTFETVAPELFALGEQQERLGHAGFGVLEIVAADGAREVTSITSAEFGECQVREVVAGGLRCVPHRAYLESEWWFSGEGCTGEQLAYGIKSEACAIGSNPQMALVWQSGDLQGLPALHEIGAAVEGSVYQKSGNSCSEADAAEVIWSLHPVLEAFDLERVLGVTIQPQGSARVQLAHYGTEAGTLLTLDYRGERQGQHIFFDQELAAPCFALRLESGSYVCLPDQSRGPAEQVKYADSDCSEPVLLGDAPESGYFAPYRDDHCSQEPSNSLGLGDVYAIGDAETGDVYEQTTGGDCQLVMAAQAFRRLSQNDTLPLLDEEVE
jgi:hypothetical protein